MKKILLTLCCLCPLFALAQPAPGVPAQGGNPAFMEIDSWEMNINPMAQPTTDKVNALMEEMRSQGQGEQRGALASVGLSALSGGIAAAVDVVTTEIFNLVKYRQQEKRQWQEMIRRECNYTDSLTNLDGMRDFYSEGSRDGAMDPSNIKFDGITLRGMKNGQECLYLSCHIDTSRLSHMFNHSKFYLVLDTLAFHPYSCHLPNLSANGIRQVPEDSKRDNHYNTQERQDLTVGMDISIFSSWINQAVVLQQNVCLGSFNLKVPINPVSELFVYSRRDSLLAGHTDHLISMEGDCFLVPRSYMPLSAKTQAWGTGEYSMKVKLYESCQFNQNADQNPKMKHWHKDYKQLCQMQQGHQDGIYQTRLKQDGMQILQQVVKTTSTAGIGQIGFLNGGGSSASSGGSAGAGSGAPMP